VEGVGELRQIASFPPDIQLAALATAAADLVPAICLAGRHGGWRIVANRFGTARRTALALGIAPENASRDGVRDFWRTKIRGVPSVEPREGANRLPAIPPDLSRLPLSGWPSQMEGSLGAGVLVVIDQGGSEPLVVPARVSVIEHDRLAVSLDAEQRRNTTRRVAILVGADPLLGLPSALPGLTTQAPYEWAGGVRGEPAEVWRSPASGLLLPVAAEAVLEGELDPLAEVARIDQVWQRQDPIMFIDPADRRPDDRALFAAYPASALLEDGLRRAGLPDLTDAWLPPEGKAQQMAVVGIRQSFAGHAGQALQLAAESAASGGGRRWVVVVDEDVDVHNLNDVLWALLTRCDPAQDMKVVVGGDRQEHLLIDATKPWAWRERFAESISSPAGEDAARERWGWILKPDGADPRRAASG
jgi:4-hydroxy-3-polyprenylbenzoate decarboxylase